MDPAVDRVRERIVRPSCQMARNRELSRHFQTISDIYARINVEKHKDHWPSVVFDRVATAIRKHRRPIKTADDVVGIPGVGKVSQDIARQFLRTGDSDYLRKLRKGVRPHHSRSGSRRTSSRKRKPTSAKRSSSKKRGSKRR